MIGADSVLHPTPSELGGRGHRPLPKFWAAEMSILDQVLCMVGKRAQARNIAPQRRWVGTEADCRVRAPSPGSGSLEKPLRMLRTRLPFRWMTAPGPNCRPYAAFGGFTPVRRVVFPDRCRAVIVVEEDIGTDVPLSCRARRRCASRSRGSPQQSSCRLHRPSAGPQYLGREAQLPNILQNSSHG